jgi:hypothetical protein
MGLALRCQEENRVHRALTWLLLGAAMVVGYTYYQNHSSQLKAQALARLQEVASKSEAKDKDDKDKEKDQLPTNTVVGPAVSPLADLMAKADGSQTASDEPTRPWKAHPNDHIAPSPVGTAAAIVHKTFTITSTAQFLFEVPPHAASPQLHGTYHSFPKNSAVQSNVQSNIQSTDETGDIDLLLMNEQQYTDFLSGRPADVVYSVDSSHAQDVSLGLPATQDLPVRYYLVFRNSPGSPGKRLVQADFRVDF